MIIARTKHDDYQYEGIQIIDVANWLSRENQKKFQRPNLDTNYKK